MSIVSIEPEIANEADRTDHVSLNRVYQPIRIVVAGMLVGLLWKVAMFVMFDRVYHSMPIDHSFFPQWLQSATSLRLAFLFGVASLLSCFVASHPIHWKIFLWIGMGCATVMLLHQGSYNDMTFATVWWCNLWCVWYAGRVSVDAPNILIPKAALLSRLITSVVLLGGASGKWTAEYWSGDVFYEIYFIDRDFWLFNILRTSFDTETLRWIAMIYSRKVVLLETFAGMGLWMLPARVSAIAGIVIFSSIALLSNFYLFSVLGPMIGLAAVGLLVPRPGR